MSLGDWIGQHYSDIRALGIRFALRIWPRLLGRKVYTVDVRGAGKFTVRAKSSDISVLRQIFAEREYDVMRVRQGADIQAKYEMLCATGKTPLIVDAGANIGAASIWFSKHFPNAKIVAVEPDPSNAHICRLNTAAAPNVQVLEAAIGSKGGVVELSHRNAAWAVRTKRTESNCGVTVRTIPSIIAEHPDATLFLVKVDIEGFESDLFASNTSWLSGLKALFVEPHDWMLPGCYSSRALQVAMAEHRFELLIIGENLLYVG